MWPHFSVDKTNIKHIQRSGLSADVVSKKKRITTAREKLWVIMSERQSESENREHIVFYLFSVTESTRPLWTDTLQNLQTHTHKHRHTAKLVRAPVEHTPNINPCKLGISLLFCSKSSKGLSQISVSSRFSLLAWCAPFSRKWWSCFSSPQCSHFVTRLISLIFLFFYFIIIALIHFRHQKRDIVTLDIIMQKGLWNYQSHKSWWKQIWS